MGREAEPPPPVSRVWEWLLAFHWFCESRLPLGVTAALGVESLSFMVWYSV